MIKSGDAPGYYKIPNKERFGYSLIGASLDLIFQGFMMFITIFYTDVFGLKPAHVTVMFLVSRLWDAINDPMMSAIAERVNPKRGKYKIYPLYGCIPFAVAAVLCYTTPNFGYTGKLIWAYATYNLLNMIFTYIVNPAGALPTVMTADPDERTTLQSWRMTISQFAGVIVAITIPTLTAKFTASTGSVQTAYQLTMVVLGVLCAIGLSASFFLTHERIKAKPTQNPITFKIAMHQLTHNKYMILMMILFTGVYTFNNVASTSGTYYVTYISNRTDMLSVISLVNVIPSVIGVAVVPYLYKKLHKRGTTVLGLCIIAVSSLLIWFVPATSLTTMLIFKGFSSFGYGTMLGIIWSMMPDSVEYADLHTGGRYPAFVQSIITLGVKFGQTIGGVIPTIILDATGYIPNQAQNETCLTGIRGMASLAPCAVVVVVLIIFLAFYDLDEKKVAAIQHEIAVRDGQYVE